MPLFGPPDVAALKAKRDVQGLIKALGYGGDGNVRRSAVAALADLGDPRAVDALCLAMKHEWEHHDWAETQAIADALVQFGAPAVAPLIGLLDWHSKVVRVAVAGALAAIGLPAVGPLIELLGDSDLETRETASQILADIGAEAVDALVAALNDKNLGRRQRAARVLGEIGDSRAVPPLVRSLGDQLAGVRQAAAKSLGEIRDPAAADALVAVLKDSDLAVRRAAALALAELKDVRGIPQLLLELRGQKTEPIIDAFVAIGPPVVEPLITALADSKAHGDEAWIQDELRSALTKVLGRLGIPEDVVALVLRLLGDDGADRSAAAGELMRLYQSGSLTGPATDLIRAVRPEIERAHAQRAPEPEAPEPPEQPEEPERPHRPEELEAAEEPEQPNQEADVPSEIAVNVSGQA